MFTVVCETSKKIAAAGMKKLLTWAAMRDYIIRSLVGVNTSAHVSFPLRFYNMGLYFGGRWVGMSFDVYWCSTLSWDVADLYYERILDLSLFQHL